MLNRVESLIQLPVCQKRRRLGIHKLIRIFAVSLPENTADCVFQLNNDLETRIQLSRQSRTPTRLNGEAKNDSNRRLVLGQSYRGQPGPFLAHLLSCDRISVKNSSRVR